MALWRVDVAGVSHRFVDAENREDAVASVISAILDTLDVRATPARSAVARLYESSGPIQQRRLIDAMDGLTPPGGLRSARLARRRLARQLRYDFKVRRLAAEA